jgi:hypothetical protein
MAANAADLGQDMAADPLWRKAGRLPYGCHGQGLGHNLYKRANFEPGFTKKIGPRPCGFQNTSCRR